MKRGCSECGSESTSPTCLHVELQHEVGDDREQDRLHGAPHRQPARLPGHTAWTPAAAGTAAKLLHTRAVSSSAAHARRLQAPGEARPAQTHEHPCLAAAWGLSPAQGAGSAQHLNQVVRHLHDALRQRERQAAVHACARARPQAPARAPAQLHPWPHPSKHSMRSLPGARAPMQPCGAIHLALDLTQHARAAGCASSDAVSPRPPPSPVFHSALNP